jgi:tRNA-dihydrouridine synthase B
LGNGIAIGPVRVPGRVWLAPMTGISDLPFRQMATRLGAAYVATEMVACDQFVLTRPDVVRRAAIGSGLPLMVVQLVGHDRKAMAAGARLAERAGAQIIDLNFGCPSKQVTGVHSGAALMRDIPAAGDLVAGVVAAVRTPVTVKMRLGWDDQDRNAPALARHVEEAGASAITVHGRTRCQFYASVADWSAVAEVVASVRIPVIVNGDIYDLPSAAEALRQSGAAGLMIGRAAIGRPWLAAEIEATLSGRDARPPSLPDRAAIVLEHLEASARFYGEPLGVRMFRKHLAAYLDAATTADHPEARRAVRAELCRLERPREVAAALSALWAPNETRLTA